MPTYLASADIFANPERGFFQYASDFKSDSQTPLSSSTLAAARTGSTSVNGFSFSGRSLVFRYYYLSDYVESDTIDQSFLDKVAADFATVRAAGCKIIPRFAYTNTTGYDATPARVLKHMSQVLPVVNQNADIIYAMQAGFIGRWGEWYYSDHFGDQANLTAQNAADRKAVLDLYMSSLDPRISLQVRYIGTRQTYFGTNSPNPGGNAARVGIHNDAFTAPYGDYGTYTTFSSQGEPANRDYLSQMTGVPVGGESASYSPPGSDWANASTELQKFHWAYLNPQYYGQTISAWGQANLDTASRYLGHRLRLVSATVPGSAAGGSTQTAQFTFINDGWTSAVYKRPVQFIVDNGYGGVATYSVPLDITTIGTGQQVTVSLAFVAPNTAGNYSTYLRLPDNSASIAGRVEYMLRLANTNMWDPNTGRNALNAPIAVSAGSGGGGGGVTPPPTTSKLKVISKLTTGTTTRVVKLLV